MEYIWNHYLNTKYILPNRGHSTSMATCSTIKALYSHKNVKVSERHTYETKLKT